MNQRRRASFSTHIVVVAGVVCAVLLALAVFAPETLARVGGGQSYGGGRSGGGSGEGAGFILWILFRLLLLTFEYPAIGIPLDIIVIGIVLYFYFKKDKRQPSVCSAAGLESRLDEFVGGSGGAAVVPTRLLTQEFNQLRKFDPN